MSDLCRLTARQQANLLRTRQVSAVEMVSAHIHRAARLNPALNAIVTFHPEAAIEAARRADASPPTGLLHGLPVAHKDLQDTAGVRTTYGSRIFANHVPGQDSLLVERMRRAGAISLGKTNTPEFGAGSQTFNEVFGATLNPYDRARTCGGSSGGGAVALATGMISLADGSDFGGSLRNPASFCNVVGFRPSPGRVPHYPALSGWFTLSVEGPMARSVEDAALMLAAIAGPDPRSPLSIHEDPSVFAAPFEAEMRGKRIAWASELDGVPFDHDVRAAVDAARPVFEALGCQTEDAQPDLDGAEEVFLAYRAWHYDFTHSAQAARHRDLYKETILWEVERGQRLTGPELGRAELKRTEIFHRMRRFFERYDFLVLPTVQVPPFPVTQPYVNRINGVELPNYIAWMKSCYYISVTGCPALSVPCGRTPEGLPVGLQIVGPYFGDLETLRLGHAFETARPAAALPVLPPD